MEKTLPIGVSDYSTLKTGGYYSVDKTLLIQEFLERRSKATLITRPRRFGKTLALSMLAEFFDITKDSTSLFKGTKIMSTEYASAMNQYPTIFLSLANCKGEWPDMKKSICETMRLQMEKYLKLLENENVSKDLKSRYQELYDESCKENDLTHIPFVIVTICELLHAVYKKDVMLFIDEFDTPFVEAYAHGIYDKIKTPLLGMLTHALKTNDYLAIAMLAGVQRVATADIFGGLNNLIVFTVNDKIYVQYFGFTKEETKELLDYYDLTLDDEVRDMYEGYHIGDVVIYNPWSIIKYANEKAVDTYWGNTIDNCMIKNAMDKGNANFNRDYVKLMEQGYLDTQVKLETSFYDEANTSTLWGLFVNAGYLTITKTLDIRNDIYQLRIPNKEIESVFKDLTAHHLHVETSDLSDLYKAIIRKDSKLFKESFEKLLHAFASYHDVTVESSYHVLLLSICLYAKYDYEIVSNHKKDKGRYDIILKAKKESYPYYVIELNSMNSEDFNEDKKRLDTLVKDEVKQIVKQKYNVEITGKFILIGLAHAEDCIVMDWIEYKEKEV